MFVFCSAAVCPMPAVDGICELVRLVRLLLFRRTCVLVKEETELMQPGVEFKEITKPGNNQISVSKSLPIYYNLRSRT